MLYDAGAVSVDVGGMGAFYRGLSWVEIMAWVEGAGMQSVIPHWRRLIRNLSAEMAAEMNRSKEADALAPYQPEERE